MQEPARRRVRFLFLTIRNGTAVIRDAPDGARHTDRRGCPASPQTGFLAAVQSTRNAWTSPPGPNVERLAIGRTELDVVQ